MKAKLLCVFPAVFALSGVPGHAAEWEVLQASAEETMLMDKDSIHRDGDVWKAWAVESYKDTRYLGQPVYPHRSRVTLYEIDCDTGQLGYAAWSFQSGELGGGSTVWADKANEVAYFPPDKGSPEEALLKRVCRTAIARTATQR